MTSIISITKPINSLTQSVVTVPGSKYLANRLLIIAALAEGKTLLHNLPHNQDIEVAGQGMEALGARVTKDGTTWEIQGTGGKIKSPATVFTGENGTFSRFVTALAGIGDKPITLDSAPQMKKRPMEDLIGALRRLGIQVDGETFPLTVTGPLCQGKVSLKGNVSSQYFSALTLSLPYALPKVLSSDSPNVNPDSENFDDTPLQSYIKITSPLVSESYLTMTLELMKKFGVEAKLEWSPDEKSKGTVVIPRGHYQGREFSLEADPVSATYFMALAALSGEPLLIADYPTHSLQGEVGFPQLLKEMGCKIEVIPGKGLSVNPPIHKKLQGITVDMANMPDAAPTLAILAACAEGKTRINGISHLRHKESNRVEDTAEELRKVGVKVKTGSQFMEIEGGTPCPALLDSHNDHRLAMSLSLLCLRSQEIKIKNYLAANKSFPNYFDKLKRLGFSTLYY